MSEQEAKERCERLALEHPDRLTHRWVPAKQGEDWVVAKIALPPTAAGTPEIRADEKPPTPDGPPSQQPWLNPPGTGNG